MSNCKVVSIDLAKNVFQVCGLNQSNKVVVNKKVRRNNLVSTVLQLAEPGEVKIVMEACYSANHWGRLFEGLGYTVELIPSQHVKPFVQGNKSDANDAIAIAEASLRPKIRPVPVKSLEQQDLQMMQRIRELMIKERTALVNQTRGLLSEYGIIIPVGVHHVLPAIDAILEDENNSLTTIARCCVAELQKDLMDKNEKIKNIEKKLQENVKMHDDYNRLIKIPGFGTLVIAAFIASVGNGAQFSSAKQFAAWLGLTPIQSGSGDKTHTGSITKRGNRELRTLLIHGARAVLSWAEKKKKTDPLSLWIRQIIARRGVHKAVVALAHKLARIAWVIVNRKVEYVSPVAA